MATCFWDIDLSECAESLGLDVEDPEVAGRIESIVAQVSEMFARWSGYAFGGCQTIRPLDPCGECRSGCCVSGDCIKLHSASEVTEVRVYGEALSPASYHFYGGELCAVPPATFPNVDPRYESVGSLEVDVWVGERPDAWALAVATEFACELLTSTTGKNCRLPGNATSISSQGVTITLSDEELRFSLPSVIAWVNSINPHRATMPARVFSPETRNTTTRSASRSSAPWRR